MDQELGRAVDPDGLSLSLARHEGGFIIHDGEGRVVMSSAERRSEKDLISLGLAPLRDRSDVTVLLGGLGMGFALRALLDDPRVVKVDVVEHFPALIEWNRGPLSVLHKEPPLDDARVTVHERDLLGFLDQLNLGALPGFGGEEPGHFLAIFLDVDNGPSALRRSANAALYTDEGLAALEQALRPGGVLAMWSEVREVDLCQHLKGRFQNLAEIAVPVDLPGHGLDYIYRCRRVAPPQPAGSSNGHNRPAS